MAEPALPALWGLMGHVSAEINDTTMACINPTRQVCIGMCVCVCVCMCVFGACGWGSRLVAVRSCLREYEYVYVIIIMYNSHGRTGFAMLRSQQMRWPRIGIIMLCWR